MSTFNSKLSIQYALLTLAFCAFSTTAALADAPSQNRVQVAALDRTGPAFMVVPTGTAEASSASRSVSKSSPSQAQYQARRLVIADQMKDLEAKGIGLGPFVTELTRLDSLYSHAQLADAVQGLNKLHGDLRELEIRQSGAQMVASAPRSAASSRGHINRSLATYSGSIDGFVDQMVNDLAAREVGRFAPHKGPFLIERFRIAMRLHELEQQKVSIEGMAQIYRQTEDIVATKDKARMAQIGTTISYLQQQLGLTQLEGTLHRSIGIYKSLSI